MGRENLSIIHNNPPETESRETSKYDLEDYLPDSRLTGIWIKRPAKLFSFEEDRLLKAFILPGLALEVISLDPDGIIRSQVFQCNNQDTQAMVGYTPTGSLAKERYFFIKQALRLVDPKVS